MPADQDIAILLTGTIIPHAPFVVLADPGVRRCEYIRAITFYSQFCPVYFLENSAYNIFSDPGFTSCTNVTIRKFPVSRNCSRGKGYQEFEMIDSWFETGNNLPKRIIKITGRYIVKNFQQIFSECRSAEEEVCLIDLHDRTGVAISSLFSLSRENYLAHFKGAYEECNDETGRYIEHALYARIVASDLKTRLFQHEPWLSGFSGSTGKKLSRHRIFHRFRVLRRFVNHLLNRKSFLF